jgi:ubiquinone/menaquinone biosynthesis C-methylase UbiE
MKEELIHDLYQHEASYWWHRGRRIVLEALLEKVIGRGTSLKIIDLGCGTGMNLELLSKFGRVYGVDASPEAIRYCRARGFRHVYEGRAERLEFADESFDMATAIELLEHMQNDVGTLREFARVLRSNGLLLLTVPAYQFLWTKHDEALGHVRRYTLRDVKTKLQEAGFVVEKGSYMVTFTSPLFAYRIWKKFFTSQKDKPQTLYAMLPSFLNNLLVYPFFLEAKILNYTSLPFGTSIVCIARKRASF